MGLSLSRTLELNNVTAGIAAAVGVGGGALGFSQASGRGEGGEVYVVGEGCRCF